MQRVPPSIQPENRDHRNIKNHMKSKHPRTDAVNEEDANDDEVHDYYHTSFNDPNDDVSTLLDLDYHEAIDLIEGPNSSSNMNFEDTSVEDPIYPAFGNDISNKYFEQEYKMFHNDGELFGGIRGVCWRSRNRLELYDVEHINGLDDTQFMFNITNLVRKNPASTNKLLYKVLSDVTDRMTEDFESANRNVKLP